MHMCIYAYACVCACNKRIGPYKSSSLWQGFLDLLTQVNMTYTHPAPGGILRPPHQLGHGQEHEQEQEQVTCFKKQPAAASGAEYTFAKVAAFFIESGSVGRLMSHSPVFAGHCPYPVVGWEAFGPGRVSTP